jgi:hypothetical protein
MINTFTIAGTVYSIEAGADDRCVPYSNIEMQINEFNQHTGKVDCEDVIKVVFRGKAAEVAKRFRLYDVITVQGKIRCKNSRITLIGLYASNLFSNTGEIIKMDILR